MAIVDELVGKISFKADGVDKIKDAAKQFDGLKKNVEAIGSPLKGFAASTAASVVALRALAPPAVVAGAATAVAAKKTSALWSVMKSVVAVAWVFRGGLIGAAGAASSFALAVGSAGGQLAKARREFQLQAKAIGTSASNLDTGSTAFEYIGYDADKAAEKVKAFAETISKTIRESNGKDGEAAKKSLEILGLKGATESQDTTALGIKALQKMDELRTKAETAKRGKGKTAAQSKLREIEDELAKGGIDAVDRLKLRGVNWQDVVQKSSSQRGGSASERSEDATAARAKREQKIDFQWGSIGHSMVEEVKDYFAKFSDHIQQPTSDWISGRMVKILKEEGVIGRTVDEKAEADGNAREDRRLDMDRERRPATHELAELRARLAAQGRLKGIESGSGDPMEIAMWKGRLKALELKAARESTVQSPYPPSRPNGLGFGDDRLQQIKDLISPEVNADKIGRAAGLKPLEDGAKRAGDALKGLDVTIEPKLNTGSIDSFIAKAEKAKALVTSLGTLSAGAGNRLATAASLVKGNNSTTGATNAV